MIRPSFSRLALSFAVSFISLSSQAVMLPFEFKSKFPDANVTASKNPPCSSWLDVSAGAAERRGAEAYAEHVLKYEGRDGRFLSELLPYIEPRFKNQIFKIGGQGFPYGEYYNKEIRMVLAPNALEIAIERWGRHSPFVNMIRQIQEFKPRHRTARVSGFFVWRENGVERSRLQFHINEGIYAGPSGESEYYPGQTYLIDDLTGALDLFRVTYTGPFQERVLIFNFPKEELMISPDSQL